MNEDRFLKKRGRYWRYRRRIPVYLQQIDTRGMHEGALRCSSVLVARERCNALETANANYWAARQKSVQNLIHVIGEKIIDLVGRDDALCFYAWWTERMKPKLDRKEIGTHSANRDLGAS